MLAQLNPALAHLSPELSYMIKAEEKIFLGLTYFLSIDCRYAQKRIKNAKTITRIVFF